MRGSWIFTLNMEQEKWRFAIGLWRSRRQRLGLGIGSYGPLAALGTVRLTRLTSMVFAWSCSIVKAKWSTSSTMRRGLDCWLNSWRATGESSQAEQRKRPARLPVRVRLRLASICLTVQIFKLPSRFRGVVQGSRRCFECWRLWRQLSFRGNCRCRVPSARSYNRLI